MLHDISAKRYPAHISIIGAGVAGTWQALLLSRAGFDVTLFERDDPALKSSTGHWAGGMLAPYCEGEATEPAITRLGLRSLDLWDQELASGPRSGTLVVAHRRDRTDFDRFARRTAGHDLVDAERLAILEPALAGQFDRGLFYADEHHVEPRKVLPHLHARLNDHGVAIHYGEAPASAKGGLTIDCRGIAARDQVADLRAVKGEMIVVETKDVQLNRPVRLIHPRWPLYIVPRADHHFMIGATTIETDDDGVSVRSALELLSAAYAVHPAFAEARIVEIGAGLRPAFPDNLPRVRIDGDRISVNGLYRHGFLLAPALAELTATYLTRDAIDNEVMQCV
ncbi:FAD-dependent oxidoreductase [Bradyrhizobium sp. LHD-71]|uniref:FAD-dependent oxidoreductase n=1 Tax=Bradyrhizobium sp. LHD-71 TaxID=3072141 RepID=UPI00280C50A5|nr:FAD-dependent oxidoreductase [Bradyrhizobium sp. LHD-71]MDQ8727791.1 FAD-dependent oxidoreductase [Bradyrhizobium sp. LHD-71]